jgi:hypothetical protein
MEESPLLEFPSSRIALTEATCLYARAGQDIPQARPLISQSSSLIAAFEAWFAIS